MLAPAASDETPRVIELTLVEPAGMKSLTERPFNVTSPVFEIVPLKLIRPPGIVFVQALVTRMDGFVAMAQLALACAVTVPPLIPSTPLAVTVSCCGPPVCGGV